MLGQGDCKNLKANLQAKACLLKLTFKTVSCRVSCSLCLILSFLSSWTWVVGGVDSSLALVLSCQKLTLELHRRPLGSELYFLPT